MDARTLRTAFLLFAALLPLAGGLCATCLTCPMLDPTAAAPTPPSSCHDTQQADVRLSDDCCCAGDAATAAEPPATAPSSAAYAIVELPESATRAPSRETAAPTVILAAVANDRRALLCSYLI